MSYKLTDEAVDEPADRPTRCRQCNREATLACFDKDCAGSEGFCEWCAPEREMPFSGSVGGFMCPFCGRDLGAL